MYVVDQASGIFDILHFSGLKSPYEVLQAYTGLTNFLQILLTLHLLP